MIAKTIPAMVLVLVCFARLAVAGTFAFEPAVNYAVGTAPLGMTTGDFNGDGKLDLAVANSGNGLAGDDGGISILLGNGDGTFQPATNVSAGKNPGSIAAADLDGDGRIDLVVTNGDSGGGQVGILLGNGDGTFQRVVDYGAGNGLKAIRLGDFNGDLRPDVVVANLFDHTVSILLGNGDGSFQTHVDYKTGGQPESIAVADFNSDGKADLAVACISSNVGILIGNGDGTFQPSVSYDTGSAFGPTDVAVGDFNGDGRPDLIVDFLVSIHLFPPPGGAIRRLDLLVGNGDGTFRLLQDIVGQVGSGVLSAADFDGDGKLDVALGGLVFYPGNGDGTFQAPATSSITPTGALLTTDLNGDKAPDLLIADQTNNLFAVVLNVGTDFSLSASPANPATIGPGQSATSTLGLTQLTGFNNPVSLSCTVQPTHAGSPVCSFDSNSVTFNSSGKATAQLTIAAGTATTSGEPSAVSPGSRPWNAAWLPIAALVFAGAGSRRTDSHRKRLLGFLVVSLVLIGLVTQPACGGGSNGGRPQAYTVTVTAKAATIQHSATVTIGVQ